MNKIPDSGKCRELYSSLLLKCPQFIDKIEYYGPVDRKTLRFKLYSGECYIFEFSDTNSWSLETEHHYFNSRSKHALI